MLENQGSRLIILATLALGLISPYFLHGIFKKRVEDNAIQEFQLQSKINLNALVAEIGSQKSTIDILQGFFKSSERVEAKEFEIFVSTLPNIKKLLAVCWHSSDLSEIYSFGRRELSKTFSFAEQDKIIAEESLLMESEYVESWKGQQGFVSIFLNLRTLLESVPQDERFRHKLLIFNNSSQQFVEISLQDEKGSQFLQGEYDLREAKPISKIGDTEVFYLMSLDPNFKARLSVAEVTVCLLTFIAVMVGGGIYPSY